MLETLMPYAAVVTAMVVPAVEALRKQVPSIDGWRVLVATLACAIVIAAVVVRPAYDVAGAIDALSVAIVSTIMAVGGDAWVAKIASKVGAR